MSLMKKLLLFIFIFLFLFFPGSVFAQSEGYKVDSFKSQIEINQDASITVKETIDIDFNESRHGIFRVIPVTYSIKGKTLNTRLNVLSITDEKGVPYQYEKGRLAQSVNLKIGDPDVFVMGEKTYVITYKVSGVIQRYESHDELYWNVTGSEWDTSILAASAEVFSKYAEISSAECFAGLVQTSIRLCTSEMTEDTANFATTDSIGSGRDLTIVIALSKDNQLVFPGLTEKIIYFIFDNWAYLAALLPLGLIFYFWFKKGRDIRYVGDTIYYKPKDVSVKTVGLFERKYLPLVYHPINGLSPGEVGTIVDERVDINDVVSEIVELARLGFYTITKIPNKGFLVNKTDYAFVKTDKFNDPKLNEGLKDYQVYLLKELFRSTVVHKSVETAEKLFEKDDKKLDEARSHLAKREYVLLSALVQEFYKGLSVFKDKLYARMSDENIFAGNPEKVRGKWLGIFILLEFLAFLTIIFFVTSTFNFGPLILGAVLTVPGIILSVNMPRRTAIGYSLNRQIEGLKWYLNKGKWRHEIAEKHLFLEEILPLAISLGVIKKLTDDMKGLDIAPPSYFVGTNAALFASDFNGFSTASASTFISAPGSASGMSSWSGGSGFGGGGSSGGGMGGGGGGSW